MLDYDKIITFLCCDCWMMSFCFLIFLPYKLCFSKIWAFVMRNKINCYFLMIRCLLFLILFHTTFNDNIHKIFNIAISVYLLSLLHDHELAMIINSRSFLYNNILRLHLLRITKNLLKANIESIFSKLRLFVVILSYF